MQGAEFFSNILWGTAKPLGRSTPRDPDARKSLGWRDTIDSGLAALGTYSGWFKTPSRVPDPVAEEIGRGRSD